MHPCTASKLIRQTKYYVNLVALVLIFLPVSGYSCAPEEIPKFSLLQAIAYMLANQPEVEISALNIDAQEGIVRSKAGPFDPVFNGSLDYTEMENLQSAAFMLKTSKQGHELVGFVEGQKKTRLGTVFSLSTKLEQVDNHFIYPRSANIGTITFQLEQPLLRDFICGQDTVNEIAARLELSAVMFDNLQTISQQILNTTVQYWEVLAIQKQLVINQEAEIRIGKLTDEIQKLIKEDQLARSDIVQPLAQIERQQLIGIQLEQDLYSAIQTLKLILGNIEFCANDSDKIILTDDFPPIKLEVRKFENLAHCLINYATVNRYDIRASMIREDVFDILKKGAYNQTLPQVNLRGGVSTMDFTLGGKAEPFFKPLELKRPQTNWSVGIIVSVPLYNDAAEGTLQLRTAQKSQSKLRTQLLIQSTIRDLRSAILNQLNLAKELDKANALVRLNNTLIVNERKKLLEGFSTLFVLLDFENRYTQSLRDQVAISKQYLQNIAQIRFLTSTLLNADVDCLNAIELADITSLPEFYKEG